MANYKGDSEMKVVEEGLMPNKDDNKSSQSCKMCSGKRGIFLTAFLILAAIIILGFALGLGTGGQPVTSGSEGTRVAVGAVAADHPACSEVGRDILKTGGSAVDAAIAALLCDGVRQPHSMGIGGGCFITIYQKTPRKVEVINGREFAPLAATIDKFINKTFRQGPLSIAVPAEVQAYWEAHSTYGKLPWADLFKPAIQMASEGHPLSNSSARALQILTKRFNISLGDRFPELCKMFCDAQGGLKKEGDMVMMPTLAKTLQGLAKQGPPYMYQGQVAKTFIQEIKGFGGLLTEEDFALNLTRRQRPLAYQYGDVTMYVPTAPSGGPVMGLILKVLEGFNLSPADIASPEAEAATYHKMIETFKFVYADRLKLGDPLYVDIHKLLRKKTSPKYAALLRSKIDLERTHNTSYYSAITGEAWDEQGTAQINVLAPNGDAVSVCSTINYYFGSLLVSPSTGIILNNEMADFSVPNVSYLDNLKAALPNYISPQKQPLSSMSPAIFVDQEGDPRLVIGSSGGSRITTVNSQVAARILWLKQGIEEAVRHKRFHHQLFPNVIKWEPGFPQDVLDILHDKYGHELVGRSTYMAVLQAITKDPTTNQVSAFSDERKRGMASLLYSDDMKTTGGVI